MILRQPHQSVSYSPRHFSIFLHFLLNSYGLAKPDKAILRPLIFIVRLHKLIIKEFDLETKRKMALQKIKVYPLLFLRVKKFEPYLFTNNSS